MTTSPSELQTILRTTTECLQEIREMRLLFEASNSGAPLAPANDKFDPKVSFCPKNWKGEDLKGRKFSECPAKFLDILAHALVYIAGKERDERKMWNNEPSYKRTLQTAGQANRWALRHRLEGRPDDAPVRPQADVNPFAERPARTPKPEARGQVYTFNGDEGIDTSFNFGANVGDDDLSL